MGLSVVDGMPLAGIVTVIRLSNELPEGHVC